MLGSAADRTEGYGPRTIDPSRILPQFFTTEVS